MAKNGAVVGAKVVKRKGCFSANPDDHVAFPQKYGEMGEAHLVVHSAGPEQQGLLAWHGREAPRRLGKQRHGAAGSRREPALR